MNNEQIIFSNHNNKLDIILKRKINFATKFKHDQTFVMNLHGFSNVASSVFVKSRKPKNEKIF